MQKFLSKLMPKLALSSFDWVAVALSVIVLYAPVTSVFQAVGGNEIVDLEQEKCSVEIAESARMERQRRESAIARVAQIPVVNESLRLIAQLSSRTSERDFLNGNGSWLRL